MDPRLGGERGRGGGREPWVLCAGRDRRGLGPRAGGCPPRRSRSRDDSEVVRHGPGCMGGAGSPAPPWPRAALGPARITGPAGWLRAGSRRMKLPRTQPREATADSTRGGSCTAAVGRPAGSVRAGPGGGLPGLSRPVCLRGYQLAPARAHPDRPTVTGGPRMRSVLGSGPWLVTGLRPPRDESRTTASLRLFPVPSRVGAGVASLLVPVA